MGKLIINEADYIHIIPAQRADFIESLGVRKRSNKYSLPFTDKNFSCKPYLDKALESNVHGLSFFSGAGGLDIGAQMAGIKVISSLDFEKDAVETM
jgi:DNA (cytosine-5)-methyltransferase 1